MINQPFFTNFLKVSNWFTIVVIVLLLVIIGIIRNMSKRKTSFSIRMMVALVLGLALGVAVDLVGTNLGTIYTDFAQSEITAWFGLLGTGFLRFVQMLAVPVVFLSIINVLTNVASGNIKSLTSKTFTLLLGTTAIAAIVGVLMVQAFNLDTTSFAGDLDPAKIESMEGIAAESFPQFFLELIPNNMFSVMTTNSSIVSVVIIGAFFAASIRFMRNKKPDAIKAFDEFLQSAQVAVNSVLTNVIKLMPYGISALVANTIISHGIEIIMSMINFILALYSAVVIMLLVYVVILLLVGVNPIKFYRKAFPTMVLGFSSRSSVGTLPYTITNLDENIGVSGQTANFVATMGSTLGMNGCAGIFPAMLGVMLAYATGVDVNISFLVLLVTVVTIGSIGIAGVPGTATVAATVTLNGIGLGAYVSEIGAVFGIDPIVDMGRTMLNVTGSMVSAVVVDRWEGNFDMEQFNAPTKSDFEDID
jgi:hypothetical protein